MAEHEESLFDQIKEKFHGADDSSSSDDEKSKVVAAAEAAKAKIFRLFGREKPIHQILGGGKRTIFDFFSYSLFFFAGLELIL